MFTYQTFRSHNTDSFLLNTIADQNAKQQPSELFCLPVENNLVSGPSSSPLTPPESPCAMQYSCTRNIRTWRERSDLHCSFSLLCPIGRDRACVTNWFLKKRYFKSCRFLWPDVGNTDRRHSHNCNKRSWYIQEILGEQNINLCPLKLYDQTFFRQNTFILDCGATVKLM